MNLSDEAKCPGTPHRKHVRDSDPCPLEKRLSDEAKSVLINAPSSEPGQQQFYVSVMLQAELVKAGCITPGGYLTNRGSIERERLLAEAEDKAFGA